METFRTIIQPDKPKHNISFHTKSLFMGSCFTNHIGGHLQELKLPVQINPFGVQYNPFSVLNSLKIIHLKQYFSENDIHFFNERWVSFYHHSDFSFKDKETCLSSINKTIHQSHDFFKQIDFLFITFGTAWAYRYNKTGNIVTNCHKIPAEEFTHILIEPEAIVDAYLKLIKNLQKQAPNLHIIFTISPIRHLKDGAVNNQLSKSILFLAVHRLINALPNCSYFPAYEIVMDDLRDYRFYTSDMIHLNDLAISYINNRFFDAFIEPETQEIVKEIKKIKTAMEHKPRFPESKEFKRFIEQNIQKINSLHQKYPFLDLEKEKTHFLQYM